ncbi:hypothetical protein G7Y89_g11859 [Cudoniella acicularis]|uniref:Uncharacterized protein n=1 Tax=Cudoniella acicularis TaxID=354080 RepID=A0A8H4RDS4_9HELO|nr:hypothetical protein G7Y89_g11859 [Cudoniella acicularis]
MKLLDLPTELFLQILISSVAVQTLKRALRLKLVNSIADECKTIFWSSVFYQSYTYYHVISGVNRVSLDSSRLSSYATIRRVAEQLCMENGTSNEDEYSSYLVDLCRLYGERIKSPTPKFTCAERAFQQDLLAGAVYTNQISTAKRLIGEGLHPIPSSPVFGSPMNIAAFQGNDEILKSFLASDIPGEIGDKKAWAALGAVKGDHLSTLNMILDDRCGVVLIIGRIRQYIRKGLLSENLDIFKRCSELYSPNLAEKTRSTFLANVVAKGI